MRRRFWALPTIFASPGNTPTGRSNSPSPVSSRYRAGSRTRRIRSPLIWFGHWRRCATPKRGCRRRQVRRCCSRLGPRAGAEGDRRQDRGDRDPATGRPAHPPGVGYPPARHVVRQSRQWASPSARRCGQSEASGDGGGNRSDARHPSRSDARARRDRTWRRIVSVPAARIPTQPIPSAAPEPSVEQGA